MRAPAPELLDLVEALPENAIARLGGAPDGLGEEEAAEEIRKLVVRRWGRTARPA